MILTAPYTAWDQPLPKAQHSGGLTDDSRQQGSSCRHCSVQLLQPLAPHTAGTSTSQGADDILATTQQNAEASAKPVHHSSAAAQEPGAGSQSTERCRPSEPETSGRTIGAPVGHHHVSFQMPVAGHGRRRAASLVRASCPPTAFHEGGSSAPSASDLRGKPPLSGSSSGCPLDSTSPGQDLCLPRFSIPESEPVSVPRVRSASDISAMLLPVRKAYPSMETLPSFGSPDSNPNQTLDDHKHPETRRNSCSSSGETPSPDDQPSILSMSDASSPFTVLSTQESEEKRLLSQAGQPVQGASPRRVRSLPTSPAKQGPSEPAAVPQQLPKHLAEKSTSPRNSGEFEAERSENGRVHGASSCSLTSRTGSSESMSIPRKSSGASRGDWLHVSNSEGSFGLLRRSLSQLTGRMSMSPNQHYKGAASLQTSLNPWCDEDASHDSQSSRGDPCSREPSVGMASGMASPPWGSSATKLHGGSGALQALRASTSPNNNHLAASRRSSHEYDDSDFGSKRRGSYVALQALLDGDFERASHEKKRSGSHDWTGCRGCGLACDIMGHHQH